MKRILSILITLLLVVANLTWAVNPALADKPPDKGGSTKAHPGKVTAAERKAAAQRAAAALQAAGVTVQANTVLAAGAMPDYFGTIPNFANSPLPVNTAATPLAVSFTGGGGTGATGTATVTNGAVTSFTVTNGGTGYSVTPTVTVSGGAGTGAILTATVDPTNGVITAITVTNGGSGYTAPTVITITGNGTGATATAIVDPLTGTITAVMVTNGGSGYGGPAVVINPGTSGGSGATATATVTNGAITAVTVTNGGSGYFLQRNANSTLTGAMRKFVDSLPGLTAAGANNLGQYIPVAIPDTTTYPGSDYYVIGLTQYTEQMHSDLLPTTLRGYYQKNTADTTVSKPSYLGPMIVAQKDRPVRVKFINELPTGADGNLFIPVDTTVMGAGMGPLGMSASPMDYTQNRATLHLHGGNTPWISDGTPHQWTTPANEITPYPKGVSVQYVPDMDGGTEPPGTLTFYYTNQQSARLMFYHDHAYGITRLNVYAGEAAGYIVRDSAEQGLITSGVIPGLNPADEIPLIIQDKTFLPSAAQLAAEDPTWPFALNSSLSNLWLPHVYMPNQNPSDPMGVNAMGRWDYGPWFWPPFTGMQHQPVTNPLAAQPGENPTNPGTPNPSIVPEAFMDTPVVNGTAYPYVTVQPKAYRFRILNASNDRMLNLQLYSAKSNATMWAASGALLDANAGEVNMVPAVPGMWPAGWPTPDGRAGGFPDPNAVGPSMIQIGSEGGILPAPAIIQNRPVGYDYNRRSITVLNVLEKALFLGPAERADVIVDFSQFAGKTLILYNDAPAPVPGFDPRYDYYTGDPDQTSTGGAPSTQPGYGPNTRTVMQIRVAAAAPAPAYNLAALQAALPAAYKASQPAPLVPESAYNAAFGTASTDTYGRIQDTTMTFANGAVGGLTLTSGGAGYTSTPTIAITGGGGSGATATATLATRSVASVTPTNAGSGYTSAPTVAFTGGGGSGAAATAVLAPSTVASIAVTNGGKGYTSVPTVTITGGGGSGATATATVQGNKVTSIAVTNKGSGYTSAPTVAFTGGGGSGATATATLTPTTVASFTVTNGGSGYTSAPTVAITGGGGSGATATATLTPAVVGSVTLTNGGSGYTSVPTVTISPPGGSGTTATATATLAQITMDMQPKAIVEDFDPGYGRMNAMLGVEVPKTTSVIQTTIQQYYVDPPIEVLQNSDAAAAIGTLADGTQIWKITHNGIDTHAIHVHMFNLQLINRVGWDGMVKPPDPNEVGWKETVLMNPLEDIIVAVRPIIPNVPWQLPNSIRLMDVTMPQGSTGQFMNVDPNNNPVTVTNQMVNYGWEYVWHCHLLGHEENDMMRPMAIAVAPLAPSSLAATLTGSGNNQVVALTWTDNSKNETGWIVQRATSPTGPWTTVATAPTSTGPAVGGTVTYNDNTVGRKTQYFYQVIASNLVGSVVTGYPNTSANSAPTGVVTVTTN